MPLWRPAFLGSFQEESDFEQLPFLQDSRVIFVCCRAPSVRYQATPTGNPPCILGGSANS